MADDPNTDYKTGDLEMTLLRKILARLNLGIATSGGGGGGGGGGAVTIADGADVTLGAKADPAVASATPATIVQLIKGIFNSVIAAIASLASIQASDTLIQSNTLQTANTVGQNGDAAITNPASVSTLMASLKGILTVLPTLLKPADTLAAVTTVSALTSGNVGGFTTVIKDTTAVSTSPAYTAGDAVGGKRTIANAVRVNGTGILQSVAILDRANQKASMTLFIFDADPTAATITDNAAFVFSTDDLKVIAQVSIGAGDYVTTDSKAYALISGLNIPIKAASGTSLFAALVTTGTPTYAATTNVQLEYGILQD